MPRAEQELPVSRDELASRLQKSMAKNPEQPVVISADKNVRYEEVINVMDMLQQQNIKKIGLLTKTTMSTALAYREPHRFSAGVLALVVHLVFFALLYFGVHWQSQTPERFMVEMWDNLPDTEAVPRRNRRPHRLLLPEWNQRRLPGS